MHGACLISPSHQDNSSASISVACGFTKRSVADRSSRGSQDVAMAEESSDSSSSSESGSDSESSSSSESDSDSDGDTSSDEEEAPGRSFSLAIHEP